MEEHMETNNKNSNNLERFVRDNREAFDNMQPSPALWDKIGESIGEPKKSTTRVVRMSWARWAVAATLFLALAGILSYQLFWKPQGSDIQLADRNDTPATKIATPETIDPVVNQIDPQYAKLVSQFTEVIGAKQAELKQIEKDDPELYKKFAGDIQKLDSSYHVLRSTLNANPNTEQLLQAMISNLQMQIELLNQQLSIIQKVKQPKADKI
jgi:ribosomal protein S6